MLTSITSDYTLLEIVINLILTSSTSGYTLLEIVINQLQLGMNTKTKLVHALHALLHMYVPKYTLLAVKNVNSFFN